MFKHFHIRILYLVVFLLLISCDINTQPIIKLNLFDKINSTKTKVTYINRINETENLNYFNYQYIYMGGGIGIGDFNNDGLLDLYFTGMYNNEFYLNTGDFIFKNCTIQTKTALNDVWSTGVTTIDINNDGLLDLYVSVAGKNTSFKNKLFVNYGNDKAGIPKFKEEADKYGIGDNGHSTQSVFFDADNDGDLDLYVANYPVTNFKLPNVFYAENIKNPAFKNSSHFYINNGDNTFTDITKKAGLLSFGLSIGLSVSDINNDGFKDIYVSNDFSSPDFIYINKGDGTFIEKSKVVTKQTSFYGMGTDISDINNDGLQDVIQLDMSPKSHKRSKENMAGMNPAKFQKNIELGLHHQYMYNTLQLNRGNNNKGLPVFSNIAALTGVKSTDWSWGSLFADFNNDGFKDLFITNGIRRDINNKDFFNKIASTNYFGKKKTAAELFKLINQIPSTPIMNYIFENQGKLIFKNKAKDWGLTDKTFSNGMAYADFDNDGDLDLVINNIDQEALIYENKSDTKTDANFLKVKFKGSKQNLLGVGNKVTIYKDGKLQVNELILTRGYQSAVAPELHFGLGKNTMLDSLIVKWTDGKVQKLNKVKANQELVLNYKNASSFKQTKYNNIQPRFKDITYQTKIDFKHLENNYFDYKKEPLLPHKMSQFGPGIAVADVNNDGLEDFWVGGAHLQSGAIYLQQKNGTFKRSINVKVFDKDKNHEDLNGVFFDADNDGDVDLYVVSGGNEWKPNATQYQDRLYINNGEGEFVKNKTALPKLFESGAKVLPIDFDNDGDLDLFVASRLLPHFYPKPPNSHFLENISTKNQVIFKEISSKTFEKLGLLTDAISIDFDKDNDQDLIVVGEWMPITFLENNNGIFKNITKYKNLKNTIGWWYSIHKTDFDKDGDTDFIVGNLGLNYKYKASPEKTFDIYANDFDNNKSLDVVLAYYEDKTQYPVRGRQCSSQQVPGIKQKFKNYNDFAKADVKDIYTTKKLNKAIHYKAETFASIYAENLGNGAFKIKNLPIEAQFSAVNTILTTDYNNDGKMDMLLAGNLYQSEVETPRNDASIGLLIEQTKSNDFKSIPLKESGFLADKDVKNMLPITIKGKKCVLIANNNDVLQVFQLE